MPKVTVEIELDTDTGQVMVGMEPPEGAPAKDMAAGAGLKPDQGPQGAPAGEEAGESSYMQPVKDVATALQVAGDMLQGKTGAQAQAANAEGDFSKGFAKRQPMGGGRPAASPEQMA